jgi:autotransporter-associated beta strand protein
MQRRLVLRLGGAILCLAAASGAASTVQDAVDLVSLSSYQSYLDNSLYTHTGMSRGLDGSQHDLAQTNIVNQFTACGLTVNLDPFTYGGSTYYNVVGVHLGSVRPNDVYMLGAHYDSVGNPGADDNASGVAGVLEAARVLSQFNFEATVVFIAFDLEEHGLIGSTAYADVHKNDAIRGMVSLDMIAYNPASAGQSAYVYGRNASLPIKQALAGALSQYGGGITPVIGGDTPYSDHAPFESRGFQACLLIEYAVWSNPRYHESSDTVDIPAYIDYGFARDMTRGAAGWMAGAAGLDTTPAALAWSGGAGATWDVGLAANWSAAGHAAWFHQGDLVTFGDAAGAQPIGVTGTVHPGSVIVANATGNIVLGGTGSIAGGGGLTKSGAGTLTLATTNAYTGETLIKGGTVLVSATGALGASAVRLGDPAGAEDAALLIWGAFTVDRQITVQDDGGGPSLRTLGGANTAGRAVFSGAITLEADLALTAAPGREVELAGMLDNAAGCTITKIGEGVVLFDGPQTHGPGALLSVEAGTVDLNTDAGSAGANLSILVTDALVRFGYDQHLDTLTIDDGGKIVFAGARVVVLEHLVLGGRDLGAMTLTPEPATMGLLVLGCLGALLRCKRR